MPDKEAQEEDQQKRWEYLNANLNYIIKVSVHGLLVGVSLTILFRDPEIRFFSLLIILFSLFGILIVLIMKRVIRNRIYPEDKSSSE